MLDEGISDVGHFSFFGGLLFCSTFVALCSTLFLGSKTYVDILIAHKSRSCHQILVDSRIQLTRVNDSRFSQLLNVFRTLGHIFITE